MSPNLAHNNHRVADSGGGNQEKKNHWRRHGEEEKRGFEGYASVFIALECSCGLDDSALEGDRLGSLLETIQSKAKEARTTDGDALPDKFWFKRQFAVGVNEVTRSLERMPSDAHPEAGNSPQQLQAVLLAADCVPRWLIRHLPSLACSRKVPLIYVRDKKHGSSRLGQLVNVRTAIAIGIKARGKDLNRCLKEILGADGSVPNWTSLRPTDFS